MQRNGLRHMESGAIFLDWLRAKARKGRQRPAADVLVTFSTTSKVVRRLTMPSPKHLKE
jgi:hypothetical protein